VTTKTHSTHLAPLGLSALVAAALVAVGVGFGAGEAEAQAPGKQAAPQVIDTSSPFSHDHHMDPARVGKSMSCNSCHEMVAANGQCPKAEVRYPKHEACAGCHTANFYTPPLTICTNCHKSASFSANNPLKELTRQVTPRRAEFSHKAHEGTACTNCHALQKGGVSVAHPSHPNCCECHTQPELLPQMTSCEACHSAAKNAGRPPSKIHDFSHKTHNTDPRNGNSTECKQCHMNTEQATSLRGIKAPPMSSCVSCHDGSDPGAPHPSIPNANGSGAFHFSSCLKCHLPGSIQNVPLPPGHPTDAAPEGARQ
jgi:hypothetical protein